MLESAGVRQALRGQQDLRMERSPRPSGRAL